MELLGRRVNTGEPAAIESLKSGRRAAGEICAAQAVVCPPSIGDFACGARSLKISTVSKKCFSFR